jgi:hypothetical protein
VNIPDTSARPTKFHNKIAFASLVALTLGGATLLSCTKDIGGPADPHAPIPNLFSISPSSTLEGSPGITVTVTGGDFVGHSVVRWNGVDQTTRYKDSQHLETDIGANDLGLAGTDVIAVFNPAPGGGLSAEAQFTVTQKPLLTPTITGVVPTVGTAGTPGFLMQVYGTNFDGIASVKFGGQAKSTLFVSPTELRITLDQADLAAPGVRTVQVVNGSGLATNTIQFVIESPVPVLTSVASTQSSSGSQESILRVYGSHFLGSSVVLFNGSPRPTQFVSWTELQATLSAADLATPGTNQVTVQNPPSPGGVSNAIAFDVVSAPLSLTGLASYGARAGGPAFVLAVHGAGFAPSSVIRWNGSDRPTTYLSGQRLSANIPASDISNPGTASITVFSPASGASTAAKDITIRALGAPAITGLQTLDIPANFLVYDKFSDRFYASIPPTAAANANSIIAINPATGGVTGSVGLTGNPSVIGLSPEGQALWVGLDDVAQVRRVDIPSLAPSTSIAINPGTRAEEIRVKPGQPAAIVVQKKAYSTAGSAGTVMFVNGNQLPVAPPTTSANNSFAFNEVGTFIYGYNNENSEFGFHTLSVRSDGIALLSSTTGLIDQYYARTEYAAGRVYSTNGAVIDAERRLRVGTFSASSTSSAIYADAVLGRIFVLTENTVTAYDMNSFDFLGSVTLPTTVATEHQAVGLIRLVRWGTDGLAFRDGTRIYILRTTLAAQ